MADWQSLDPEAAREAEKYENPIPSRELILQHLLIGVRLLTASNWSKSLV
jgi:hypothetical protein